MNSPHLLNASSNCRKLLTQLRGVIDQSACDRIEAEIARNAIALFRLGESHFLFARSLTRTHWRQKTSRFYYGAYNVRRSINLFNDGTYNTDVSDHKKIDSLPSGFPNLNTYGNQLTTLRDDRNLADYDHEATEADLILTLQDAEILVDQFLSDSRGFLNSKGLTI